MLTSKHGQAAGKRPEGLRAIHQRRCADVLDLAEEAVDPQAAVDEIRRAALEDLVRAGAGSRATGGKGPMSAAIDAILTFLLALLAVAMPLTAYFFVRMAG